MNSNQYPYSQQLEPALSALNEGGVIAYPTEAVWGLGCDPQNPDAFKRLLKLKQRQLDKGVILIAANASQLKSLRDGLSSRQLEQLAVEQAVPTTWLIPADRSIPSWIKGRHTTVAVRISNHPVAAELCRAFGGMIVSTSANRAGQVPARTLSEAQSIFSDEVDAYVAGEVGGAAKPSRIVDLLTGQQLR